MPFASATCLPLVPGFKETEFKLTVPRWSRWDRGTWSLCRSHLVQMFRKSEPV